jgi:hypothetical protein
MRRGDAGRRRRQRGPVSREIAVLRHWRYGQAAIALLLVAVTAALMLVWRSRFSGAETITAFISAGLSLPALFLAWASYRTASESGLPTCQRGVALLADQLAVTVENQWRAEAHARGLDDPTPLQVSWTPADPALSMPWEFLVHLAANGTGWPSRNPHAWATSPAGLARTDGDLAATLAAVPTGRLIVLGQPDSGKTALVVRLVLSLLAVREPGDPVPVLAHFSSWNPLSQGYREWLAATIMTNHPTLADIPPVGVDASTSAEALLASGLILPILDGLDEMSAEARAMAISAIDDGLRPGERIVMTSRSREYREAVKQQHHPSSVLLTGAAAIELLPLNADTVRRYLLSHAAGRRDGLRWEPVIAALGDQGPLAEALTTPLMVSLANAVYNPRPGEPVAAVAFPAELCDPRRFPHRAAVEEHLLAAYLDTVFNRDRPGDRPTSKDASRWLSFLAGHLLSLGQSPDLAWWRLPLVAPTLLFPVVVTVVVSVALAVVGAVVVETADVRIWIAAGSVAVTGILTGVAVFLARRRRGNAPVPSLGLRRLARRRATEVPHRSRTGIQ